jgi:2-polyprenyl-6-methoxyphenol hydroxylase-like FAD-dependent oxidoreductase
MPEQRATVDVLIAGGGPAGAATALALRRAGVPRVALVEAGRLEGPRIGESIPPDTRVLLAELGLWDAFAAEGHDPCHGSCSSWGDERLGYNDFLFNPYGNGFHLDRCRFDPWLARAAGAAGATVLVERQLRSVASDPGGGPFRVELTGPGGAHEIVTARFLVDATGRPARLARMLGARRLVHDRLTFVYAFFPPGSGAGTDSLTLVEAVPYGWWYAARLPDGRLVVAVATDPDLVRSMGLHQPAAWRSLADRTRHVAGLLAAGAAPAWPLVACDAPSARLDRAGGAGWLAAGDAASSFDPISAQGIHKALADALHAADAIAQWLGRGDAVALDNYVAGIASRFDAYLQVRAYLYGLERRWLEAPFWARRQMPAQSPTTAMARAAV